MSKVVQVANFVAQSSGGIRTVLDQLAAGYARHGHEVVQIVPGSAERTLNMPWGIRRVLPGWSVPRTGYRLLAPAAVTRELVAAPPDRLEVHDRTTLRSLGRWARERGIPAVVFSHERLDRVLAEWLRSSPTLRLADRSNARLAASFDAIVCATAWAAEEFRRLESVAPHVVPLGVDVERFTPQFADAAMRARIARGGEALLVTTSRLSHEKRPDIAIRAAGELTRRGVPVRLVVAGDGPQRAWLRRLIAESGWPVQFVGFIPQTDLARWLACADAVLAPGPAETFCLAALEALACGTPVVANAASAVGEILGPAGLTASGAPSAFADAVEVLLSRPRTMWRDVARRQALRFQWSETVRAMLAVHDLPVAGEVTLR